MNSVLLRRIAAGLWLLAVLQTAAAAEPVEVTFLSNEGVLLRAGVDAVAIDAFVGEAYSLYGHLPEDALRRLLSGEKPFDSLRLALISHAHRDHLQPEVAVAWLRTQPDAVVHSSEQAIAAIREAGEGLDGRLRLLWPEPGKIASLRSGGIEVSAFRLSHGSGRFAGIQNLGHVIGIGGKRFLHVGDAEMVIADFEPFEELLATVDVALLPYWYWSEEPGRKLIERFFAEISKVALHLPPAEVKAFEQRLADDDDVTVFRNPLDSRPF